MNYVSETDKDKKSNTIYLVLTKSFFVFQEELQVMQ